MLIIEEFKRYKQYYLDRSSPKQEIFYKFLNRETLLDFLTKEDLTDIEQMCLSIFCTDVPSRKKLIERKRKEKVIGGMHYTRNLIELTAMAIDDLKQEEDNLKTYCQDNPTRHFFILNQLFPDLTFYRADPQGSVDQIALHLCQKDLPKEGWKTLLINALYEISDLNDFYVVEQGYHQAMDDHPIIHQVNDILYVKNDCERFVKKTERNVKLAIGLVLFLLLVGICFLVPTIREKWNEVEPIFGVTGVFLFLIVELIFIFRGKILDRTKFTKMLIEKITNFVFKKKGCNRLQLKESLCRLVNVGEK